MTDKLKRLIEQREAMNARIRQEQTKLNTNRRRADTRRKVLAGATVLEWAKRDDQFSARLTAELNAFLSREPDRELFALAPVNSPKRGSDSNNNPTG